MAFRLFCIDDAAIDGGTDAYRAVEFVFSDQFPPLLLQIDFVAGNHRQTARVVHSVSEEKDAVDLVSGAQDRLCEA